MDAITVWEGRGSVSPYTGDLVIHNLEKSDEGLYRCSPTGMMVAQLQLSVQGKKYSITK